jgi:hypothetical protein
MGEIIQGPWRRRNVAELTGVLGVEIARMTRALEDLRELHRRSERCEVVVLPAVGDSRKD